MDRLRIKYKKLTHVDATHVLRRYSNGYRLTIKYLLTECHQYKYIYTVYIVQIIKFYFVFFDIKYKRVVCFFIE